MTLIAEDLLLLLLDDETGRIAASTYLDQALGGALLVELALSGALEVRKDDRLWARAKVYVDEAAPAPADPLLAAKLAVIAEHERTAQDLVGRLGKGTKDTLLDRLAERGIIERQEDRVLGVFPRRRWPAVDSSHEDGVRRGLTASLVGGATPDERTSALVALLHAIDQAHKVVDRGAVPAHDVKRRAKDIAEGDWAAKAVREAVQAAQAAMIAVVVAATAGGAAGG
jgi:hypothetical protein